MTRLQLVMVLHNHQPLGNDHRIVAEMAEAAYRPLLRAPEGAPGLRHAVQISGPLLAWMERAGAAFLDTPGEMVARGPVELLTGGLYEPVLAAIPSADRVAQVTALSDRIQRRFGVRPQGLWLTKRVWDPQLVADLVASGVRYLFMDDRGFITAGITHDELPAPHLTEEGGERLLVFPLDQRLRYLIPWEPVEETEKYLEARAAAGQRVAVFGDDGEKFGAWPETHEKVYAGGWPLVAPHHLLQRDGGVGAAPDAGRGDRPAEGAGRRGGGALRPVHPREPLDANPGPIPRGQPGAQEDAGPPRPAGPAAALGAGLDQPAAPRAVQRCLLARLVRGRVPAPPPSPDVGAPGAGRTGRPARASGSRWNRRTSTWMLIPRCGRTPPPSRPCSSPCPAAHRARRGRAGRAGGAGRRPL